jgi:hypothetical protein
VSVRRALAAVGLAAVLLAPAAARAGEVQTARDRAQARAILRDRRFTGTDLPRPFAKPLRWVGDRLRPVTDAVGRFFDRLVDSIPGGPVVGWLLLALLVAGMAALIGRNAVARAAARGPRETGEGDLRESPHRLERLAEAAERDGRWEEAVRLRFRAGLLRLDERRALDYRPSMTTGEAAAAVGLESFDRLGATFDAVAYGGRTAAAPDAEEARRGWASVLEEARRG